MPDHKKQVYDLLCEYSDLFSQGVHMIWIELTSLKYQIDTGDAPPMRQQPHGLPLIGQERGSYEQRGRSRGGRGAIAPPPPPPPPHFSRRGGIAPPLFEFESDTN